jgi:hypothetical protein
MTITQLESRTEAAFADALILPTSDWQVWFAWYPVRLLMSRRHAWLRSVHRRCVNKAGYETCEYTDDPAAHPAPELALRHLHHG